MNHTEEIDEKKTWETPDVVDLDLSGTESGGVAGSAENSSYTGNLPSPPS